ncbi:MAG: sugar transferase [Alphaproteobacteria bacterium]|nr:MAG: sugar transferase [Alphaproteobacteria bacterium]
MKRAIDIVASFVGLLLLAPLLAAVAVLILVRDGRPVLFRQERPGRHGRPFRIVKFRTMTVAPSAGAAIGDTARVTRLGKALRASSIDELPELWNVLVGDMSLVGPRPLLTAYLPLYSATQARRHEVRPGLTGLAQVRGRNAISWEAKFALDVFYVDNRSLWLDLRILGATAGLVLRRSDIDASVGETMPVFTGSRPER